MTETILSLTGRDWRVILEDDADQSVAAEIFKWREYRAAEEYIRECRDVILDVGAHKGFFVLFVRSLNPGVPIVALEPEPGNIEALRSHLEKNMVAGVTVVLQALAGESGKRSLEISPDSHNHRLLPVGETGGIPVAAVSFGELRERQKIRKISLVKMDIEGGEYEVFENLTDDDFRTIGAFLMEYHGEKKSRDLEKKLREHGFGVRRFPSRFDKTMGFLFAKNKRI